MYAGIRVLVAAAVLLTALIPSVQAAPAEAPTLAQRPPRALSPSFGPCSKPHFAATSLDPEDIPYYVAAGDVNGDGKLDLIMAIRDSDEISISLGKGDGSFQAASRLDAGDAPIYVAVGDLNGDGKPDLVVVARVSKEVLIFMGNGDGTFVAPVSYATGREGKPQAVTIADLDEDGDLDLVIAFDSGDKIALMFGNGSGGFSDPTRRDVFLQQPMAVVVGDFDDDSHVDLAVVSFEEAKVGILLGDGDGNFDHDEEIDVQTMPIAADKADLNGDGRLDLIVVNSKDDSISILIRKADGGFEDEVSFPVEDNPQGLVVGDWNGDGLVDIAVVNNESNSISMLFGKGNADFQSAVPVDVGRLPLSVAVGDFNQDGQPDLVAAASDPDDFEVSIRLNECNLFRTLTIERIGEGRGTVNITTTGSAEEVICDGACTFDFPANAQVRLIGRVDPRRATFQGWGGACTGAGTCDILLDTSKQVTARFEPVFHCRRPNLRMRGPKAHSNSTIVNFKAIPKASKGCKITFVRWDFGDPTATNDFWEVTPNPASQSFLAQQTYTFPGDGTYTATFTARDNAGNVNTASRTFIITQ